MRSVRQMLDRVANTITDWFPHLEFGLDMRAGELAMLMAIVPRPFHEEKRSASRTSIQPRSPPNEFGKR